MDPDNKKITRENSASWLASCGFIFPADKMELSHFHILYGETDPTITGEEVDPLRIIRRTVPAVTKENNRFFLLGDANTYRMVAHKLKDLPPHIIRRLQKDSGAESDKGDSLESK